VNPGDVVTLVWGLAPLGLYAFVLRRAQRTWFLHRDRRALRELVWKLALAIAAAASAVSFLSVVLSLGDPTARRVLAGVAYAAFGAAAVVMLQEHSREED
jgi:hypothetical protein